MGRNRTSYLVRCYRFCRLLVHVAYAVILVAFFFPQFNKQQRALVVKHWSVTLLRILNVRLDVKGKQPAAIPANTVVAANHVSWLDIFLLYTQYYTRFVAKAEVRTWPVIGWLNKRVGTLFIERIRRRDVGRMNREISQALSGGDCVTIFPEGTTSDGTYIRTFHPPLLEPAAMSQSTVLPVALRFRDPDGGINTEVAYAGETTLMESILGVLGQQDIRAELIFTEPIPALGKSRRDLTQAAETAIVACLRLSGLRRKPEITGGLPGTLQTDSRPTNSRCPAPEGYPEAKDPALTNARK